MENFLRSTGLAGRATGSAQPRSNEPNAKVTRDSAIPEEQAILGRTPGRLRARNSQTNQGKPQAQPLPREH